MALGFSSSTHTHNRPLQATSPFLSTVLPIQRDRRLALGILLVSVLVFLGVAPFAQTPLTPIAAFFPAYQTAVIVSDTITFVLLLGQYNILRSRSLFVLACGYLFCAAMATLHALSFPGLFAPAGLLNAGPQTTAWLYFFWHGGFPLFVIAYALLKGGAVTPFEQRVPLFRVVWGALIVTLALACVFMWIASSGAGLLPQIMNGDRDRGAKIFVALVVWAINFVALGLLWWRKPHSLLDMWLMVIMCIWVFDVALAAVLNNARYDVGWYMGRVYGLAAASFVLNALLLENSKLHAQLASANARGRAYLHHLVDPVITIDSQGVIGSANPALERVLGYPIEEVMGRNVSMLMPLPQRHEHDGYLRHYLATGEAHVIASGREVVGLHKNGELIPLWLSVSEVRLEGGERQFVGTLQDLRERNRLIRSLNQARTDAEQANHAKSAFLATMSHEIRTPLAGMLGMLELLSLSRLDEEQQATVDAAWDSGRGLLRIVSDILDWSKIEEGKLELAPRSTSVSILLNDVVNTYSRVASAKCLILWQHSDARLGPAYLVDPLRLSQVLNNFVSNAIKFTSSGEVEVRAELINRFEGKDQIRFSVKDSGPGIALDVQAQLFQRYRQESADTARMYGGTGLGLAICRLLADLMDGQIGLQSEPGRGSVFSITLTLPISNEPCEVVRHQHHELRQREVEPLFDDSAEAPLVLAVDDHPINRDMLARQVQLLGLRAATAENGRVALSMWQKGGYALIITDCHMPEIDGYALSKEVRALEAAEQLSRTPIIAWTANALADEVDRCKAADMDDLLVKPANLVQLRAVLARWLPPVAGTHRQNSEIDYGVLDRVIADPASQRKVLADFLLHIQADGLNLAEALVQGDRTKTEDTAHRMKGASLMVGATTLAVACEVIEQAARSGDMAKADANLKVLNEALARLRTQLERPMKRGVKHEYGESERNGGGR